MATTTDTDRERELAFARLSLVAVGDVLRAVERAMQRGEIVGLRWRGQEIKAETVGWARESVLRTHELLSDDVGDDG